MGELTRDRVSDYVIAVVWRPYLNLKVNHRRRGSTRYYQLMTAPQCKVVHMCPLPYLPSFLLVYHVCNGAQVGCGTQTE